MKTYWIRSIGLGTAAFAVWWTIFAMMLFSLWHTDARAADWVKPSAVFAERIEANRV